MLTAPKMYLEELRGLPTPPATKTHQPIPHHDIAEVLLMEAIKSPLAQDCNQIELRGSVLGDRMDCSLVWKFNNRLWSPGVAVSHANNKRRSLRVNMGLLVQVCSNGLVVTRGEQIGFRRRHVPGGQAWDALIREYVGQMDSTIMGLDNLTGSLRGIPVHDGERRLNAWEEEGWLPKRAAHKARETWASKELGSFPDRDAWCLYNHLNHQFKAYTPRRQSELLQTALDKCLAISPFN